MIEIWWRVIKAERHRTESTGVRELLNDILSVWRVGYLVVGVRRIEHTEAVVMLRCEDHVFLAGSAREIDQMIGIPFGRIEPLWQSAIVRLGNSVGTIVRSGNTPIVRLHNGPGGFDTGKRIWTPMDKHPEFRRAIPRGPFVFKAFAEHETGQKRHRGSRKAGAEEQAAVHQISAHLPEKTIRSKCAYVKNVCDAHNKPQTSIGPDHMKTGKLLPKNMGA